MYFDCQRGMSGVAYPDGRGVLYQPVILAEAWRLIGHYAELYRDKDAR